MYHIHIYFGTTIIGISVVSHNRHQCFSDCPRGYPHRSRHDCYLRCRYHCCFRCRHHCCFRCRHHCCLRYRHHCCPRCGHHCCLRYHYCCRHRRNYRLQHNTKYRRNSEKFLDHFLLYRAYSQGSTADFI